MGNINEANVIIVIHNYYPQWAYNLFKAEKPQLKNYIEEWVSKLIVWKQNAISLVKWWLSEDIKAAYKYFKGVNTK